MGRHERPIVEYWKILSELTEGTSTTFSWSKWISLPER